MAAVDGTQSRDDATMLVHKTIANNVSCFP